MSYSAQSTAFLQSTELTIQNTISGRSQRQAGQSQHAVSIHILDDDSLLNIFYLYRPFLLGEDGDDDAYLLGGKGGWVRGHWWYRLAHVCRRWRNVVLGSTSYLGVSLVCAFGTPVEDMLAHSPRLPLAIDYSLKYDDITEEDEERAILALKQRDRIRRVRLDMPVASLRRLVVAMDEEYPILEHLIIIRRVKDITTTLRYPETLQAPHLRHLTLGGFTLPMGSKLFTTAVGLVTLNLIMTHPSTYFYPNTLLQWLSFMPQLETLVVVFSFPVFDSEMGRLGQPTDSPIMAPVPLPNLRRFTFRGFITYLEAFVHQIITPHLEKLQINFFFNQFAFSVPHLLEFMNTVENLRFDGARFKFVNGRVGVEVYPRGEAGIQTLSIAVDCWHLDWQVSTMTQISGSLRSTFSMVEHLTLEHDVHNWSSEEHNEVDRSEWKKLLRSFGNVKNLHIDNGLVKDLSLCLQLKDGELPLELLPELQELTYSMSGDSGEAFTSFIDVRQKAGRPIALVRRNSSPGPAPSSSAIP